MNNTYHCKVCGQPIHLNDDETGYCPICDKEVNEFDVVPTRCIDPIMQYCQGCRYGYIDYPSWVETSEDLDGCCFDSGCIFGLEDTQPTEKEIKEFEERCGIEV